jgi:hypothetical protein
MIEGSGSGSIPLNNGFGSESRRPKKCGPGSATLVRILLYFAVVEQQAANPEEERQHAGRQRCRGAGTRLERGERTPEMPGQCPQTVAPARHDHERPPPEEAEGPGGGRHAGPAGPGHGRHRRPTGTAPDKIAFTLICDVSRTMVFHILDSLGF